jgi:hypothetical protein
VVCMYDTSNAIVFASGSVHPASSDKNAAAAHPTDATEHTVQTLEMQKLEKSFMSITSRPFQCSGNL